MYNLYMYGCAILQIEQFTNPISHSFCQLAKERLSVILIMCWLQPFRGWRTKAPAVGEEECPCYLLDLLVMVLRSVIKTIKIYGLKSRHGCPIQSCHVHRDGKSIYCELYVILEEGPSWDLRVCLECHKPRASDYSAHPC
jgi:hypothetical protein